MSAVSASMTPLTMATLSSLEDVYTAMTATSVEFRGETDDA